MTHHFNPEDMPEGLRKDAIVDVWGILHDLGLQRTGCPCGRCLEAVNPPAPPEHVNCGCVVDPAGGYLGVPGLEPPPPLPVARDRAAERADLAEYMAALERWTP